MRTLESSSYPTSHIDYFTFALTVPYPQIGGVLRTGQHGTSSVEGRIVHFTIWKLTVEQDSPRWMRTNRKSRSAFWNLVWVGEQDFENQRVDNFLTEEKVAPYHVLLPRPPLKNISTIWRPQLFQCLRNIVAWVSYVRNGFFSTRWKRKPSHTVFESTRSSTATPGFHPFGKTVSPPSSGPISDMYKRMVANLLPPVPPDL
jgi:hypothetical protein